MKHYFFRIITIAIYALYGISASSETIVQIGNFKYSLNGLNATVYKYVGSASTVTIPESISYNGTTFMVDKIGNEAFQNNKDIYELFVPKSVKTIERGTGSYGGAGEVWNGHGSFMNSSIVKIHLPGIVSIGMFAFSNCEKLKIVDFGINSSREPVEINDYAFNSCKYLTYIVLPTNSRIFNKTFCLCDQLQYAICLSSYVHQIPGASLFSIYDLIKWSKSIFDYTGEKPSSITWTNNSPAGFAPTNNPNMSEMELESDAGSYECYVPFTFANSDMSFSIDIPYQYTINKIELKARVKDASRIYGDDNPQFETEYSGFVNGEDKSAILSEGQYITEATRNSSVGTYTVSQSGAEAKNYSFKYEDGILSINKALLTITANDKNMVYGGQVPTLDVSFTGLKNDESKPEWTTSPTVTTEATSTSSSGTYPIIVSGGVAKNYDLNYMNGTLTIEKAELTLTAENKERFYGDANPELTLLYSGLKNNEIVPEWVSAPELETHANKQSPVGEYPITIKNAIATNYNVTTSDGVLTINKAILTAKPVDATRRYGEENPQFELSFEGLKNNESSPEWTIQPSITTNATKTSDVGNYIIEIASAEARNYILNKGVGVLTITKSPIEVGVSNSTKKYGERNPAFTLHYSGLKNEETEPVWTELPTFSTIATNNSGVGEYEVNAIGGMMKNYETSAITPGTLTITPSALIIRPHNATKLYFEDNPSFTCTYEGFIGNDNENVITKTPTFTTTATKESNVGVYQIVASGAEASNYEITYSNGELTINKRQLNVSTNNYTRVYNEDNPIFELSYDGFVNSENEDNLMLKPTATTIATKNSDTGVYDIIISGGFAENYDFNYNGGKLTIEKAYQDLTWNQDLNDVMQYDQVELTATATSGLDINYTIEGAQICTITRIGSKTYLDCFGTGETIISAIQEGNKNYWQTTKSYKVLKITGTNGINQVMMEIGENCKIYDFKGNRLQKIQRGINIIKMEDGTIKKIVVK